MANRNFELGYYCIHRALALTFARNRMSAIVDKKKVRMKLSCKSFQRRFIYRVVPPVGKNFCLLELPMSSFMHLHAQCRGCWGFCIRPNIFFVWRFEVSNSSRRKPKSCVMIGCAHHTRAGSTTGCLFFPKDLNVYGQVAVIYWFPSDHWSQALSSGVSTWMVDHPGTPRAVGNTWCTGHTVAKPGPQFGRVC